MYFHESVTTQLSALLTRYSIPFLILSETDGSPLLSVSSADYKNDNGDGDGVVGVGGEVAGVFGGICRQIANLGMGEVTTTTTFYENMILTHVNMSPLICTLILYTKEGESAPYGEAKSDEGGDKKKAATSQQQKVNVGCVDSLIRQLEVDLEPIRQKVLERVEGGGEAS